MVEGPCSTAPDKGVPVIPPPGSEAIDPTEFRNVSKIPSDLEMESLRVAATRSLEWQDRWRMVVGCLAFLMAAGMMVWTLYWATETVEMVAAAPDPSRILVSKAIIVASVVGISTLLLRIADRMSMSMLRLIEMEEARSKKPKDEASLDLVTRIADLVSKSKAE